MAGRSTRMPVALIVAVAGLAGLAGFSALALAATIVGNNGNDTLTGTPGHDRIVARAGNDHVIARAGDDTVNGGFGHDRIALGTGNLADSFDNVAADCERVFRKDPKPREDRAENSTQSPADDRKTA